MRGRIVLSGLALALAASAMPVFAASSTTIRITGRTTAFVDFDLKAPATFEEIRVKFNTRGSYAAWWVRQLDTTLDPMSAPQAGSAWFVNDPAGYPTLLFGVTISNRLPAGRYRLTLATDGQTTIDVPVDGLARSLTFTPTRRLASGAGSQDLEILPGGIVSDRLRQPTRLPSSALVIASTLALSSPGTTVRTIASCVAIAAQECRSAQSTAGQTTSLFTEHAAQFSAHYYPGQYEPGPSDTVHSLTTTPGTTRAIGYFLWISM